jgi:uncharacterized protein (TIGR03435 family)
MRKSPPARTARPRIAKSTRLAILRIIRSAAAACSPRGQPKTGEFYRTDDTGMKPVSQNRVGICTTPVRLTKTLYQTSSDASRKGENDKLSAMGAKRIPLALLYVLVVHQIAELAHAQTSRFEVASVKPCAEQAESLPGTRKGDGLKSSPARLHLTCQTLMSMIQWAYVSYAEARYNPFAQIPISGGLGWINTERFQIEATSEIPQKSGALNGPMLRALLEDRFHLVIRRDVKETSVYALTFFKGAVPKMPRSAGNCIMFDPEQPPAFEPGKPFPAVCGMSRTTDEGYDAAGVTMGRFAELLSDYADRKVIDRTDLSGEFDIHLNLSAADLGHPPSDATSDDAKLARDPVEIFTKVRAVVQKLGLHIEPAKGPSESLFVERAEKPSAN